MRDIADIVRPNIKKLTPFSSARAEFDGVADVLLDANENPFDNGINRYPDPYQRELKDAISKWKGVPANQIFLGNGSDEIIDILIRTFCNPDQDRIRYIYPSFGMYQVMADINAAQSIRIPLDENFDFETSDALKDQSNKDKLLFLCSPNNPTGNSYDIEQLEACISGFEGLVVVDEAYVDFSTRESCISLLGKYENLVVLQTFSKALGAAGLRIGMAFSNPKVLAYMVKVKPPYNIGSQTQLRALDVLSRIDDIQLENKLIIEERGRIAKELSTIDFVVKVHSSDANFLLVEFEEAAEVLVYLRGLKIIVRDRSKLPHCSDCLRVTVGTMEENDRLIKALKCFKS